ncbi:MAG TPA: hypothetical protein IGS17_09835 [Oscillatoriales cyanobacterium M59_W2019_021]|nr:MAG: hypothetical protein D6728_19875 [Cyanobacteria bacterium J055]HIK33724.1 hypothetical protein [Oscillatoriales cyanobacterium M4454_W2019_049]HIK51207.1 hypothetical protein [Oscillatoriales cyanobacterium M59_W2019_021]
MSYLVFFENIAGKGYLHPEQDKVEYLSHPPELGDRISLGTYRLWTIVGIDRYENPENSEDSLYLAHCTVDPQQIESVDRSTWFKVRAYQNRDPNLQLFFGEGILRYLNKNLIGKKPETGYLLPQYNVKEHTVTSKPWGIDSVTSYFPSPDIARPCYNAVHVCQCVYVPEVATSQKGDRFISA